MTDHNGIETVSNKAQILEKLENLKSRFEGEEWWSSKVPEDVGRRAQTKHLIQQLRYRYMANQLSSDFMLQAIEGLRKPLEKKRSQLLGISVGFKRPHISGVEWIDVHGTCEPSEAVRIATQRPEGIQLLSEGYAQHGTSPVVSWKSAHEFAEQIDDAPISKMTLG